MKGEPYRSPTPTRPRQPAQASARQVPEDEITKVRCPTCLGEGMIPPEHLAALEADAKRREAGR